MSRTLTLVGYAVLLVLLVSCEVVARHTGRVATLAQARRALARSRPMYVLVLLAWLWVGWHLFVRAR